MADQGPHWLRLRKMEAELAPMSDACRTIRREIERLEACHECYLDNVEALVAMIASMTPGSIRGCGEPSPRRKKLARTYAAAVEMWMEASRAPDEANAITAEVFDLLGDRTDDKLRLAGHLAKKLRDNAYAVYADEDEDFKRIESRIQHLDVCNFNWHENLRIVLREIAAGGFLCDWHGPGAFNAHGDCPERIEALFHLLGPGIVGAGAIDDEAGAWGKLPGEITPEKRWLAAVLCERIRVQHGVGEQ